MIPCQRHMFDIPDDVAYFNLAYTAPLLKTSKDEGQSALRQKQHPWSINPKDFFNYAETTRRLFADLIDCSQNDVAIIPAVSYGIALAAKNIPISRGRNIIILKDQFPSNVYSWIKLASDKNCELITVERPEDNNWTNAIAGTINKDTAIVALGNCHWTDGSYINLVKIGELCRTIRASLVIDGTQSLGAIPFSVKNIQPDFVITTSHKWLLGPYSYGFCYIAPKWQKGVALEENWINRLGSENFTRLVDYQLNYQPGARRYDVGEVSNFILSPIAAASLRQILDWGVEEISATLKQKTDLIAERAQSMGFAMVTEAVRSPHMLGITWPSGFSKELPQKLAQENVFVSVRGESIRISPHLFTTEEDISRLFSALKKTL
jgi:selenocysteine lyase/cysteine desulfurase